MRHDLLYSYEVTYAVIVGAVMLMVMVAPIDVFRFFVSDADFARPEIQDSMRLIFISSMAQLWLNFYVSALLGIEQHVKGNVVTVISGVVRSALVIIPIWFMPSPVVFLWWQLAATLAFVIVARGLLYRLLPSAEKARVPLFNFSLVLHNSTFTGPVFLISITAAINTQIDKVFIGRLIGLEALAPYSLVTTLAQLLVLGVTPITLVLLPRLVRIVSSGDQGNAVELFQIAHRVTAALVCAGAGFMVWFGPCLIDVWTVGKIKPEIVSSYLPMLVIGYSLLALQMVPHSLALANKNMRGSLFISASIFLTVPCYWFFIGRFGPEGAAATWLVLQTIVFPFYFCWVVKSYTKFNCLPGLIFSTVLIPLTASILLAFAASRLVGEPAELARNLTVMALAAIFCTVVCLSITLRPSDRSLLMRMLAR
jgi:O-antigen/teichoic acid export membrane protein